MAGNPFHDQADDEFIGRRVRVQTDTLTYEGWLRYREYQSEAVLLADAEREGTDVGSVVLHDVNAIEHCEPDTTIERIPVSQIKPSPYSQRSFDTSQFREFVRSVRERGDLIRFPLVRPIEDGKFEIVSGHRRCEAARQAGLNDVATKVTDLGDWEATTLFLDEHVPTNTDEASNASDSYSGFYTQPEVEAALERLREDWDDEKLQSHPALSWYLSADNPYDKNEDTNTDTEDRETGTESDDESDNEERE